LDFTGSPACFQASNPPSKPKTSKNPSFSKRFAAGEVPVPELVIRIIGTGLLLGLVFFF